MAWEDDERRRRAEYHRSCAEHRRGYTKDAPLTLRETLFLIVQIVIGVVIFFAAAMSVLYAYASWGGSCIESGGKIVGDGPSTHCEGGR